VRSAEHFQCGVRSAECGVRSAEHFQCGVRSAECPEARQVENGAFATRAAVPLLPGFVRPNNRLPVALVFVRFWYGSHFGD
jgi:hypothetical protein